MYTNTWELQGTYIILEIRAQYFYLWRLGSAKDCEHEIKRQKDFQILHHDEVDSEGALIIHGFMSLYATPFPKAKEIPLPDVVSFSVTNNHRFKFLSWTVIFFLVEMF